MAKYSYNGVILPALPNVGATHPKMCICMNGDNSMGTLYCFSNDVSFRYNGVNAGGDIVYIQAHATSILFELFATENVVEFSPLELPQENANLYSEDSGSGGLTPIWSNFDIIAEDGSVFLAASDPVEVKGFDLRSFLTGLALGLSGKPLPLAKKEPIAYLYNGVRLPKLPEWDRVAYPYAAIYTYHGKHEPYNPIYRLVLSDSPFKIIYANSGLGYFYTAIKCYGNYIAYWKIKTADDWSGDGSGADGMSFSLDDETGAVIWANTDIFYADDYSADETLAGTLYLAASEPIPVYE